MTLPTVLFVTYSMQVAYVKFHKLTAGMPEKNTDDGTAVSGIHAFSSGKIKTKNRLKDTFPDSSLSS
jgi:hypothetical protein